MEHKGRYFEKVPAFIVHTGSQRGCFGLTGLVFGPTDFPYMNKNRKSKPSFVLLNTVSHTGFEQHKGEKIMTQFWFD